MKKMDINENEYKLIKWFVEEIGFTMVGLEPEDLIELGDTNVYRLESVNKTIKMINGMVADWQQVVEENLWD